MLQFEIITLYLQKKQVSVALPGNDTDYYVVNDTHESRDFEMSAGQVYVSGNVTDILGASNRLEGATITLYPLVVSFENQLPCRTLNIRTMSFHGMLT